LGVDARNISTARMTVGEAGDISVKSAVREASVAVGWLGSMAEAARGTAGALANVADRAGEVLHSEEMGRDKSVPPDVR